ncbi:MAG: glutaredoxin family protein [Chloroflexi bacterium]|nr:glutaredoxin family protein [Chloroflexota bacterium]
MPKAVFYSRKDCYLCDQARAVVGRLRGELGLEVEEVDINQDESAHLKYWAVIPVLALEGGAVLETWISEEAVRNAVRRAGPE